MEHNLKQIGNRIFIRRKELEITQKDFANSLNISNNHLSNIERGRSAPKIIISDIIDAFLKSR